MPDYTNDGTRTCGEFLSEQRQRLSRIGDLGTREGRAAAAECLANIYAVSYQMNFERPLPPAQQHAPAEQDPLDRETLDEYADMLRRSGAFHDVVNDPLLLDDAVRRAGQGNGFPLIEAIHAAHLTRSAGRAALPQRDLHAPAAPLHELDAAPAR